MSFLLFIKTIMFRLNNVLMFESYPDLSSNTYPVFVEFLRRNFNKKYFFLWKIRTEKKYPKIKNVFYWVEGKKYGIFKKTLFHILFKHIRANICCNGFLLPRNNNQISFYLTHGTFIKNVSQYYNIPKEINYMLAASNEAGRIVSQTACFPYPDRIAVTGYPYNDDLTNSKIRLDELFEKKFKKYIVWYPTYKQHKLSKKASTSGKPIAIIDNLDNAFVLNKKLQETDTLLIIKPHFAQDLNKIKDITLSNIVFIEDDFFFKNKITSYSFIGSCDALVTDYSAVYFDYLLCDKPIGAVWEDIEEYRKFPGFCVDISKAMAGALKIFNVNDFIDFIECVSSGNDILKDVRNKLCDIYNVSRDGKNSIRATDFIISKCNLKI